MQIIIDTDYNALSYLQDSTALGDSTAVSVEMTEMEMLPSPNTVTLAPDKIVNSLVVYY